MGQFWFDFGALFERLTMDISAQKNLIVIAGPTASGKTNLAIRLAQLFKTEIVSADSRQFYREIPIGTAQPSAEELNAVQHHLIASHSIHAPLSAGIYEQLALGILADLFQKYHTLVLVGGSGLYIKSLLHGIDAMPEVSESIRESAQNVFKNSGLSGLQEELERLDPLYLQQADKQNPVRLVRALEVIYASGKPFSAFRTQVRQERPFKSYTFWLEKPRKELYERINTRAMQMLAAGWLEEAEAVIAYKHLQALQTLGYKEIYDFFDGKIQSRQVLQTLIQQHTRQYAKRQMTWFRNQSFCAISSLEDVLDALKMVKGL